MTTETHAAVERPAAHYLEACRKLVFKMIREDTRAWANGATIPEATRAAILRIADDAAKTDEQAVVGFSILNALANHADRDITGDDARPIFRALVIQHAEAMAEAMDALRDSRDATANDAEQGRVASIGLRKVAEIYRGKTP